jgi:XTP/dITP diphosphohydrolase
VAESELDQLAEVMTRLRRECAWKANQTHRSLTRYLLEETYEVLEAIESGDPAHLREELGDLLLQVYFHAAIAAENGQFDIDDVAGDLIAKLVRRNPHVFAPGSATADPDDAAGIDAQWERIKAEEKQRSSLMEGVPDELPALLRAVKAVERIERSGAVVEPVPGGGVGEELLALAVRAHREGLDPEQELRTAVRRLTEPR